MKILYLIPPSEGKTPGGTLGSETLSFDLEKPLDLLKGVTEKDLKCRGERFKAAQSLHHTLLHKKQLEILPAIKRYSGVMYNALHYSSMNGDEKTYFDTNFFILSGLYGFLKPQDLIANYKLPVEAKGVANYWKNILSQALNKLEGDMIVDLLPQSYKKMIDWKQLKTLRVEIEFLRLDNGKTQKLAHGVKKVKGEYIKNICKNIFTDMEDFPGNLKKLSERHWIIEVYSE